jgi:hypothetical protein
MTESISIVIFANRKDFFLTKLCVASIRYYYPNIEIYLVKDSLNGNFNSKLIEKKFNVKLIKLSKRYFGWGAAKLHYLIEHNFLNKKVLFLDSDIIFLGNVIDKLLKDNSSFVINPEYFSFPLESLVKKYYVDPDKIKHIYPQYDFPGYFFNVGQMVLTPSLINEFLFNLCFDKNKFPYYTNIASFNTAEQSILNVVLPVVFKEQNIKPGLVDFMKWSVSFFEDNKNDNTELLIDGNCHYLLHYAGDVRTINLKKMKGFNLLSFFKNSYYSQLNVFEKWYSTLQDNLNSIDFLNWIVYKMIRLKMKIFKIN